MEPATYVTLSLASLAGLAMIAAAALKGWRGWLDLKRAELDHGRDLAMPPSAGARIDIADIKERIRKLEAIAAGVEL